jgi:hypothetical protein
MKKLLLASGVIGILVLSGCQQIQDQAENLRKQSDSTINGFSQQAEGVKTKVLETKAAYDQKSQQVVNTVDAVNKLMK